MRSVSVWACVLSLALSGCEEDDPITTPMEDAGPRDAGPPPPDTGPTADMGPEPELDAGPDATVPDSGPPDAGPMCMALATDYTPRVMMSATDTWPACPLSDDGTYDTFAPSVSDISSVARIAAFENIVAVLGWESRTPTAAEDRKRGV
jgi:hypothetical protein